MKTIRGKLLMYFFVFIILFQVTAISIFVSSNELTNKYNQSFQRFLLLNSISQKSDELYAFTRVYVLEPDEVNENSYFNKKAELKAEQENLRAIYSFNENIKINNYINLVETFIHESELTVGFVLKEDIEQYTKHLEEVRLASGYIQESALELIDVELTAYQTYYKELQERNGHFITFIIFLFITTIAIAIFFAIWFSRGITRPLHKLSLAAKEVSKGDLLGEAVEIQSNDELRLLGEAFNNMRSNIHNLVKEIKDQSELDQLLKEMELKHLQNQINPHFLFNTLNTVSKMAYLEDANSTSRLIESVAALLRHSLGNINDQVTLKDEVNIVQDYFRIQQTRFSERVQFITKIDESSLDIEIPRLTLQPLVENAFIHGIEEREEGGIISIKIEQTDEFVVIEVSDDGEGIDKEKIEQLLSLSTVKDDHVGHSTGIGLTNVIRRLQLYYQMKNVVEIESEKGQWTTIRLLLPKSGKGAI
ncbi:sensor histidine kinase [Sporosarcina sp. G11-34]|uniref:sensor histidine kinase n=1 Tax=Sporosarcina sp. G11-34 TaxID=2849605 RepID=UPI0022A9938C|nr:sensor histidine kinase [Sporosarcina sp. G11-34]MCZ2258483.1 sensor histidine kinase [Sporosarcina sp. G11-34]